jgi:flagellar basal-body rod protein FlgC
MGAFDMLGIANSSLGMHQTWLDALANNIANANDVTSTDQDAFQAQYVRAQARPEGGVEVAGIEYGSAEGLMVSDPENPLADANGMVRAADVDMPSQMSQLIMAQRGYQANLSVVDRAKDAYEAALNIGKG